MSIEAMKQALETHKKNERHQTVAETRYWCQQYKLLAEQFIQAIEQAEQAQPFGYFQLDLRLDAWVMNRHSNKGVAFYTAPPPRQPLTHPQIHELDWPDGVAFEDILMFARAIEAAHGIKGEV
jgi:hypothetical protein